MTREQGLDLFAATLCQDTGYLPQSGACPVHGGDNCLVGGPALIAEVKRLRRVDEAARVIDQQIWEPSGDWGETYHQATLALRAALSETEEGETEG